MPIKSTIPVRMTCGAGSRQRGGEGQKERNMCEYLLAGTDFANLRYLLANEALARYEGLEWLIPITCMPVFEQRGAASIVLFSLCTLHTFLLIFASHPSLHSFLREIRDILLFEGEICIVLQNFDISGRFGISLVWVDFMTIPSVRKIGSGLEKDLVCSKGALTYA